MSNMAGSLQILVYRLYERLVGKARASIHMGMFTRLSHYRRWKVQLNKFSHSVILWLGFPACSSKASQINFEYFKLKNKL